MMTRVLISSPPPGRLAKSYAKRFALGFTFTVVLVGGCSNEVISSNETATDPATDPATDTATAIPKVIEQDTAKDSSASPGTARLIVTLKTTDTDYTVKRLTSRFPEVKIVRTMPAFSQLVVELPNTQIDALTAEPFIVSVAPDTRVGTLQNKP